MAKSNQQSRDGYILALWGLAMHLIVLWGVLDANFHSPILKGLEKIPAPTGAPAKRIFLFVADGLRYRTFNDEPAPFLKGVMKSTGSWGVSHTRMPTESRPGNVAIAAGLYEDPSALFKGWKENPVDFDSIFNQSSVTWAWGSPDIIPMFAKANTENIHGDTYPHEWQNFDKESNSTLILDSWVFEKYFQWLKNQAEDVKNQNGVILFFHLLGCDTAGHASKPHSKEYKDNLRYVDEKIAEIFKSAEDFFADNRTAYLFTADHGMTDWGSHGSGSTDETETPIVAWGAGVSQANNRQDIAQADITPLIASLLGISIPVNSEGVVPLSFLNPQIERYQAQAILSNIKQLNIQVRANRIRASGDNARDSHWREKQLDIAVNDINHLLLQNKVTEAISMAEKTVIQSKEALYHYRRSQRNQLIMYLTIMWLGWIVVLFLKLIGIERHDFGMSKNSGITIANIIFVIALLILIIEHNVSGRNDWRVVGYGSVAFTSLWTACRSALSLSPRLQSDNSCSVMIKITGILLLVLVMSAGLINKVFFSLAMVLTAAMQRIFVKNGQQSLLWTALILAVYPALPTVKPHPQTEILLMSLAFAAVLLRNQSRKLIIMEVTRLILTVLIVVKVIDGRRGTSWIILFTSPICIFFYPVEDVTKRLTGVTLGLLGPLALLSATYEPQVYILLAVHLIALLESLKNSQDAKKDGNALTVEDLVTAAYFMLYILLSFFGTGNMASISSFDPMWTQHFITIFSPFTMSALILLKLGIPLILVGCASRALASSSMFLAVLLLGDCLSLPLMYSVTSKGSWLDIGTAISRYTIAICLPCLFLVLYHLSSPLMTFSLEKLGSRMKQKKHLV